MHDQSNQQLSVGDLLRSRQDAVMQLLQNTNAAPERRASKAKSGSCASFLGTNQEPTAPRPVLAPKSPKMSAASLPVST